MKKAFLDANVLDENKLIKRLEIAIYTFEGQLEKDVVSAFHTVVDALFVDDINKMIEALSASTANLLEFLPIPPNLFRKKNNAIELKMG